ncbi:MAG: flagellar hook-basal body protein [Anaerolineales bacterium]|nr:flagellar hook-basal body protein [Anaerolineales bacterium]
MIKGLYAAASAMIAGMNRQNALAHNISNMDTPGFKQILVTMGEFVNTRVVHPPAATVNAGRMTYVGTLGLGVEPSEDQTIYTQGALKYTSQQLDFAIEGPGFFRVETPNGERYTRDGRFIRDAEGQLVTVDGYYLLDANGQHITLPEGDVMVLGNGTMYVDNAEVAQIGLAGFANPETDLTPDLPNTFTALNAPNNAELGIINQGYLEMSNADPAELMTQMVMVSRAYEAAQQMVQNQDELLGKTIARLGQV